jgi:hypothetical protein
MLFIAQKELSIEIDNNHHPQLPMSMQNLTTVDNINKELQVDSVLLLINTVILKIYRMSSMIATNQH